MIILKKKDLFILGYVETSDGKHRYSIYSGYLRLKEFESQDNSAYKKALGYFDLLMRK